MIRAENVTKIYKSGKLEHTALNAVSFSIATGTIGCIIGKSGSGKSTLLRQLGLIDTPTSGKIWIDDVDTSVLSEKDRSHMRLAQLGYIFQEYALIPEMTALENVLLPSIQLHGKPQTDKAKQLLAMVGLEKRIKHAPKELSGGEQQRVAIARAMINTPQIIFADEPTSSLDSLASIVTMHALTTLSQELGTTVVFVTHDPDQHGYAQQLLNIQDGTLVEVKV